MITHKCNKCGCYISYVIQDTIFRATIFDSSIELSDDAIETVTYCPICRSSDVHQVETNDFGAYLDYDLTSIKIARQFEDIYYMDYDDAVSKYYLNTGMKYTPSDTLNGYFKSKGLLAECINDVKNGKYIATMKIISKDTFYLDELLQLLNIYDESLNKIDVSKVNCDVSNLSFFKKYIYINGDIIEID